MLEKNFFVKSHGLGNDYIVLDSKCIDFNINSETIKKICDVHYGIGSDGILLYEGIQNKAFKVRIFNPDGSEAEKSGNGLRIIAKYLYDYGYVTSTQFDIETIYDRVRATIEQVIKGRARLITIDMGKARFLCKEIPVNCETDECFDYILTVNDKLFKINCVSLGNPHCVIFSEKLNEEEVKRYGPLIENNPLFPNRINVQFVQLINEKEVKILIWERGAGYTLASGSSACAVAAVMYKKGYIQDKVTITMPGGKLSIHIDSNFNLRLTGEVQQIAEGIISDELIEVLQKL